MQPRRSARMAARFQSTRSSHWRSTSRDTEPISDGLSDDPVLSKVDVSPAPSHFVCDGHFSSSGPLSRCVLQCCSFHPLAVCHQSGASAFSICPLPRLVPPSDLCFFFISSLLPSTHSLRMFGSVSSHLRLPLPFLCTETSSPSCLTPFLQPLSSTSTFTLISTHPLPVHQSILFVSLMPHPPPIFPRCCAHS